jgi:potassium-transporting ATPase KdpC subunit
MQAQIRPALTVFVLLTLLTGVAYPALVTTVGLVVFPFRANGSVLERDGKPVGSELIGQTFDGPEYFWGRPSATTNDGKDLPYNAAASGGSNLGPTNPTLHDAVRDRIKSLREAHPDQTGPVPVDLVTASASGLDPHISPAAAEFQVMRVANARGMSVDALRQVVAEHTEGRTLAVLGEARVNVLTLNLALDRAATK